MYRPAAGRVAHPRHRDRGPHARRRAQLYFDCLRRLLEAAQTGAVKGATTRLLGAVIDAYLPVNVEDRVALRVQLEAQGQGGAVMVIEATELTWRDQVELEAAREATRKDIRTVIQARFGQVAPAMQITLKGLQSEEALDALLRRVAVASTEDDLL